MTRTVITISRQVGSGDEMIAERLAAKLGVPLLEREIITRAASLAGVSEETVQEAERVPSFLARMVDLLGRYPMATELGAPTIGMPPTPALSTDAYRHLIEDVIINVAKAGGAVMVGHGGQLALKDYPHVLRLYIAAPFEKRIKRLMEDEELDEEGAKRRISEEDRRREDFYRSYHNRRWTDPLLYDLMINTEKLGIDGAVDVVLKAVEEMESKV